MPTYFAEKEQPVAFSTRLPASLKRELESIATDWTESSRVGSNPTRFSLNDVMVRLLQVGVEGVRAEQGLSKRKPK